MAKNYKVSDLIAKCQKDKEFKEAFKKNPKQVFEKECKHKLPDNIEINVMEDTQTTKHIVIPYKADELSEKHMESISGGHRRFDEWPESNGNDTGSIRRHSSDD